MKHDPTHVAGSASCVRAQPEDEAATLGEASLGRCGKPQGEASLGSEAKVQLSLS